MFSLHAVCGAINADLGENAVIAALRDLKKNGKIRSDGYVLQSDVDAVIRKYAA